MNKIKLIYEIPGGKVWDNWCDEIVSEEDCESLYDLAVECGYTGVRLTNNFTRLANCITEYLIDCTWDYTIVHEKYLDRILKVSKGNKVVAFVSSKKDLIIDISKDDQLIQSYIIKDVPCDNDALEYKARLLFELIYKLLQD